MELSTGHGRHSNNPVNILSKWIHQDNDDERDVLVLNVLLLGNRQCGRSSVGNALIGQWSYGNVQLTTNVQRHFNGKLYS